MHLFTSQKYSIYWILKIKSYKQVGTSLFNKSSQKDFARLPKLTALTKFSFAL